MEYNITETGLTLKVKFGLNERIYKNEEIQQFGKQIIDHYKAWKKADDKIKNFAEDKPKKFVQTEISENGKNI